MKKFHVFSSIITSLVAVPLYFSPICWFRLWLKVRMEMGIGYKATSYPCMQGRAWRLLDGRILWMNQLKLAYITNSWKLWINASLDWRRRVRWCNDHGRFLPAIQTLYMYASVCILCWCCTHLQFRGETIAQLTWGSLRLRQSRPYLGLPLNFACSGMYLYYMYNMRASRVLCIV